MILTIMLQLPNIYFPNQRRNILCFPSPGSTLATPIRRNREGYYFTTQNFDISPSNSSRRLNAQGDISPGSLR